MNTVPPKLSPRILFLEDNLFDRELLVCSLRADGLKCDFVHAESRHDFEAAIVEAPFDLIISDYSLPGYDGMTALAVAQKLQPQTPFIFVSGTIGEERAVESLKNGATDYVLKDRRDRVVAAVRRALREGQEHAERKLLEAQLRQSQKMDAVGQLAGGVAHDFNNLLAVIQGNTELALMRVDVLSEDIRENLTQIGAAAERAASLTRQLLAFSRKQPVHLQPVDLSEVVRNLTRMLRRLIGENIRLECDLSLLPAFVQADVSMLDQILLNLVVNARDAMPQGGDLLITTRKVKITRPAFEGAACSREGEHVRLTVRDTGGGIAPEHLSRIFEPFFTTKEVGKGTGLGLATVYGIVQQHKGWIETSSEVGKGTEFRIFFPAIEAGPDSQSPAAGSGAKRGGNERILLVEDEPAVRLFIKRVLTSFGYRIEEGSSGREALQMMGGRESEIDLLLTDVVMPDGLNGLELANALRAQRPDLKVVFMSGYGADLTVKSPNAFNGTQNYMLHKPFRSEDLVDLIRHCLDSTQATASSP